MGLSQIPFLVHPLPEHWCWGASGLCWGLHFLLLYFLSTLSYLFGFTTISNLMTIKGAPPTQATSGLGFRYPYPAAYLTFPLGQPVFVSCLFCPKHKSSTFSLQACAVLPNIPHLSNWPRSIVQIKESRNVLHSPILSYLRFSSSSQQVPLVLLPKFSEIPLIFTSRFLFLLCGRLDSLKTLLCKIPSSVG